MNSIPSSEPPHRWRRELLGSKGPEAARRLHTEDDASAFGCEDDLDPRAGLILVGIDHRDPRGFRRTRDLLNYLQPDLVLVELSPFGRALRAQRQRSLLKTLDINIARACLELCLNPRHARLHPEIIHIRRQICLPFEYRAARRYCAGSRSKMLLCDSSEFSRRWTASWPEMISLSNIRLLLSMPSVGPQRAGGYATAARALAETSTEGKLWNGFLERRRDSEWDRREHHLARMVEGALHAIRPAQPVYLGGWDHLLPGRGRPTLRGILGVPAHRCVLLDEVGVLRQPFKHRVFRNVIDRPEDL